MAVVKLDMVFMVFHGNPCFRAKTWVFGMPSMKNLILCWDPTFSRIHAMGAPFYHVSGNTAKHKMRHLCGLSCTSCNISRLNMMFRTLLFKCFLYLYIYFFYYVVLMSSLLSFSIRFKPYLSFTCLKRFSTKLAPILWLFLSVDWLIYPKVCRGSAKKMLFSVCFVFFDPPSDPERLLLSCFWETRRLSCFYDHPFTIWPDWLARMARINPVHYNQTFKPDS